MKYHTPPFHPQELKIEVTYKCPLACIHCSSEGSPTNNITIDGNKCLSIINEAIQLGINEIAFSGGEAIQYSHIKECIQLTASHGISSNLYSSGNVSNFKERLALLHSVGLTKIIFSLYSTIEDEHEEITRIKGSYKKTIKAMKDAHSLGLGSELHFTALARNYRKLPEVVKFVKTLGIKKVSILRFVPQGRGRLLSNDILSKIQNLELKHLIENLRKDGNDIRTGSPFNFLLLSENPSCDSAINRLIIAPDLRIYPCDAFKQINAEELVGTSEYSILDGYTLEECWEKSPYLLAIRKYLTTNFEQPCVECSLLEKCLSGCLAQKVLVYSNMDKNPDPACIKSNHWSNNE